MEKRSVLKKVVDTFSGAATTTLGCEFPETPGLKLPQGKISTATQKQFLRSVFQKKGGSVE
jgi:hypothetical protein